MALTATSVPGFTWPRTIWILAAVAAVILFVGIRHNHRPDTAKTIAAAISGTCTSTKYGLVNNLTGAKTWIYSCVDATGKTRCMVRTNGVVADVTAEARLVYQNSFSGRPGCLLRTAALRTAALRTAA